MGIKKIGVLGAGAMGGGIAHVAAMKGFEVVICDIEQRFVDGAIQRATKLMDKSIAKQKLTEEEKEAILNRMSTTTNMEDFASVDFVVEAIIENLKIKSEAFANLDKICRPDVILATNSSSMSVTAIAAATKRPDRVIGMHFFNPAQVMRLVEIIRGYSTSDETLAIVEQLGKDLGKTPIVSKKDTPGFIVNRLLFAQFLEALQMVEEGVATPQDIDTGVKLGLNYPMGPFEMMDSIGGIDLTIAVMDYFYDETKNAKWAAPHAIKSLARAGRLGRKVGAGFYDYEK
ncbi:MAG: 3-hydroxyacyl-CoA dehydrogenase [Firmicutes bacterium]|nr:3-hydroxyacyl-CoA dehydrogenase [Bacillota bacterium]